MGNRFVKAQNKCTYNNDIEKADSEDNVDRTEFTHTEVLKAINSINKDLKVTMEICKDFEDEKLPTARK